MGQPEIAEDAPGRASELFGRVLDGRYEIVSLLGEGGLGQVFRATDRRLARSVAIKIMHPVHVGRAELRARFEREARSLAALSHPNVVGVVDYGVDGDVPFLVMELLVGRTLEEALAEGLPAARVIPIIRDVLRAVAYAHAQGLVHRDLKPANVFLQQVPEIGEVVRVLDFGLAKFVDAEPSGPTLTRAGMVLGTPAYMSPEQATGGEVDARTDVYALGIMLFELATGERPFKATDAPELLRQHLLSELPGMKVAPELEALVRRAAAKSRSDRFKDGQEMAAALDALPPDSIGAGGTIESGAASAKRTSRPSTPELDATMAAHSDAGATLASRPSERPPGPSEEQGRRGHAFPSPSLSPTPTPSASRGGRMVMAIGAIGAITALVLGAVWWLAGSASSEPTPPAPAPPQLARVEEAPVVAPTKRATSQTPVPDTTSRPFDAATPPQLAAIEARVRDGREITADQRRTLFRYSANHPRDPRAWILMGHADFAAGARTDACARYERAFRSDEAARNDETMRHDLLVMSGHRAVAAEASRLVVAIYGASALPHLAAIEQELASDRDAIRRIHSLRRRLEHAE